MFSLTGKTALVTGSTQGIGYAIAKCLSAYGARVYVHGRDAEKCARAAETIPNATAVVADLSVRGAAKQLYELTGEVDILILNASVQYNAAWTDITDEEFDRQVQVNLKASLDAMQLYGAGMKERGFGRIITVGSVQQYKPHRNMAVYAATKCAQMSLVRNIGKQLAPFGVTVNNLSPGVIDTPRNAGALSDPVYSKQVMAGIPMGYAGEAEDLCGAALLLCGKAGRYITGTDIVVDGGMAL